MTEIGGDWLQHRSVQVFFAEFIRPGAEMEKPVSGAGWLPNTNGYADLVYNDQVWEVKLDTSYYTESNRGTAQLAKYLTHMPGHVPGEFIPNFLVPYNDNTLIVVHSDLRRPGLLFYRAYASRNPLGDKLFERAVELLAALWAAERLSRLPKPNPPIGPVTP